MKFITFLMVYIVCLAMLIMAIFFVLTNEPQKPIVTPPEPHRVVVYEGQRCLVYDGWWRGAPMYVLLCNDNSTHFTRDWIYVK